MPLRDAVAAVGRELGMPAPDDVVDAVGRRGRRSSDERFAAHTAVRSVRDGVCTVEVDGPAGRPSCATPSSDLVERAERALRARAS